jgi:hypothetical protein
MRKIISATAATVFAMGVSVAALAQQPAPMASGSAKIFTALPAGTTVTNFYKQNVYDPSDNKIGDIDDVLIDKADPRYPTTFGEGSTWKRSGGTGSPCPSRACKS